MERKLDIRNRILRERRALSQEQVEDLSDSVCAHILHNEMFYQAEAIYGYMPIQNEADIRLVLKKALQMGKKVALPRVEGDSMEFYEIQSLEDVEPGSFKVMEPKKDCPLFVESGLMLVPLVVFDNAGNRIGYGKGFYDRYINSHKDAGNGPKILLGVGYEMQRVDKIPADNFDYPMDYLVTEKVFEKRG